MAKPGAAQTSARPAPGLYCLITQPGQQGLGEGLGDGRQAPASACPPPMPAPGLQTDGPQPRPSTRPAPICRTRMPSLSALPWNQGLQALLLWS